MLTFVFGVFVGILLTLISFVLCWFIMVERDDEERPNIDDPGFS